MKNNNELKVLFYTYLYVPYNVTGTFRLMRLIKYLPDHNVKPWIVSASHKNIETDTRLNHYIPPSAKSIYYPTVFPSYDKKSYTKTYAECKTASLSKRLLNKSILLVKDLLLSPDIHITWVWKTAIPLYRLIRKEKIQILFATGAPYSLFLLSVFLKQLTGVKVVLDFQDPWQHYFTQNKQSFIRKFFNRFWEHYCVTRADLVITVTPPIVDELIADHHPVCPVMLLPNSYDPDEFKDTRDLSKKDPFIFLYAGRFEYHNESYNPTKLLESYQLFTEQYPELNHRFYIITNTDKDTLDFIEKNNRHGRIKVFTNLKRDKILDLQQEANAFVHYFYPNQLLVNLSIKMFEYSQQRKPIISFSSTKGMIASYLIATNTGKAEENSDMHSMIHLWEWAINLDLEEFRKNINDKAIQEYNVVEQAKTLTEEMRKLL